MNVTYTVSDHPDRNVVVHITNTATHLVSVQVEPWALTEPLQPGEVVEIRFEGGIPGEPKVEEWSGDVVFVWGWTGAVPKVYRDGKLVGFSSSPSY